MAQQILVEWKVLELAGRAQRPRPVGRVKSLSFPCLLPLAEHPNQTRQSPLAASHLHCQKQPVLIIKRGFSGREVRHATVQG
jgi:hypothetical protein